MLDLRAKFWNFTTGQWSGGLAVGGGLLAPGGLVLSWASSPLRLPGVSPWMGCGALWVPPRPASSALLVILVLFWGFVCFSIWRQLLFIMFKSLPSKLLPFINVGSDRRVETRTVTCITAKMRSDPFQHLLWGTLLSYWLPAMINLNAPMTR